MAKSSYKVLGVVIAVLVCGIGALAYVLHWQRSQQPDPAAFAWVNDLIATHWCCSNHHCLPGNRSEALYLQRGSYHMGSMKWIRVSRQEWEDLDESDRAHIPADCVFYSSDGKEWSSLLRVQDGVEFVYDDSLGIWPIERREEVWAVSYRNIMRDEVRFTAFRSRGDCMEERYLALHDDEKKWGGVSKCARVRLINGQVRLIGE